MRNGIAFLIAARNMYSDADPLRMANSIYPILGENATPICPKRSRKSPKSAIFRLFSSFFSLVLGFV